MRVGLSKFRARLIRDAATIDSAIVIIMTHGVKNSTGGDLLLLGYDHGDRANGHGVSPAGQLMHECDKCLTVADIERVLMPDEDAKVLANMPKVVIAQACRSSRTSTATATTSSMQQAGPESASDPLEEDDVHLYDSTIQTV